MQMDLDSEHPFSQAFDYASDQIGRRFQNPLYPVTEFLFGTKLHQSLAEVEKFGSGIVAKARRERSNLAFESLITNDEPIFDTLIDALLEALRYPKVVADSALNFLSAGKDTTAQSLVWTLYALLRDTEAMEILQREVSIMHNARSSKGLQSLTFADLQPASAPMIMAIFYEALRLYPPVPFEIQECQQDLDLPDGTFLPKGAVVVWCIWAINRATEIHGSDAHLFRPQRWLDSDGKFVYLPFHKFPVFNGGPRSCLGRKMAEVIAMFTLCTLLQDFIISPSGNLETKQPQNSLTLPMKNGLHCHVAAR